MDCTFCGNVVRRGTEVIYVTKRGKALYFCSQKCEKNMLKLRRKPRETKWTEDYRAEKAIRTKSGTAGAAELELRRRKAVESEEVLEDSSSGEEEGVEESSEKEEKAAAEKPVKEKSSEVGSGEPDKKTKSKAKKEKK